MNIKLGKNAYGKNAVNLSKIIRHADHHEFMQASVSVALEGDFETAHTLGDNSRILATDTQKNTVYILARQYFTTGIEDFALYLANYFVNNNPQVSQAKIEITEHLYARMSFDGQEHPHAFIGAGDEKHITEVVKNEDGIRVSSGIKDLLILKTTDSGFEGYIKDEYTSLKETSDRILATRCEASWIYNNYNGLNFADMFNQIRNTLIKTFAFHKSFSVQQTLYAMGEAVLQTYPEVKEISLIMPNKHHIPFNMEPFGLENKNEIFIATDEPFGYITGTVVRG